MRIVGGAFRGRRLASLGEGAPDAQLRPTSDRVREAIFNVIAHGPYPALEGARVLDLFAGAGALGLEALSRGAARALFVDDHPKARALLRENIEICDALGRTKVFRRDATRLGPHRGEPFDILFLDPPYGRGLAEAALRSAMAGGWARAGALAVLETGADEPDCDVEGVEVADARVYGGTKLQFLTLTGGDGGAGGA